MTDDRPTRARADEVIEQFRHVRLGPTGDTCAKRRSASKCWWYGVSMIAYEAFAAAWRSW